MHGETVEFKKLGLVVSTFQRSCEKPLLSLHGVQYLDTAVSLSCKKLCREYLQL